MNLQLRIFFFLQILGCACEAFGGLVVLWLVPVNTRCMVNVLVVG